MLSNRRPGLAALVTVLALTTASCSAGTDAYGKATSATPPTPASSTSGPAGDAFYSPPHAPAGAKAGDVIWSRQVAAPPQGAKGYDILYWSEAVDRTLVASSGVVFWPDNAQPGPRNLVAWAHGTAGLGDQCAPSKYDFDGRSRTLARDVAERAVAAGAVFVAPDYQGLGTPGDHPYLVGVAAGHDVLNSVRAATAVSGLTIAGSVVLGESQGGGAALFAAELAPTYAPDVHLKGAVAVAPPSDLTNLSASLDGGPYFGYTLMAIAGIGTAYPEATSKADQLPEAGREALAGVEKLCGDVILTTYAGKRQADLGLASILQSTQFQARLRESEPGYHGTSVPILLVHGTADDTIPVASTHKLVAKYCAEGVSVTSTFPPGRGHADTLQTAFPQIQEYLSARLADAPAPPPSCG